MSDDNGADTPGYEPWDGVIYTPDGGRPRRLGGAEVLLDEWDGPAQVTVAVRPRGEAFWPVFAERTLGILEGVDAGDGTLYQVINASVQSSGPDRLVLLALSADGTTSPVATAAPPRTDRKGRLIHPPEAEERIRRAATIRALESQSEPSWRDDIDDGTDEALLRSLGVDLPAEAPAIEGKP